MLIVNCCMLSPELPPIVKIDGAADSIPLNCYRLVSEREDGEAGFVHGDKHPSYFGADHFNETRVSSNR